MTSHTSIIGHGRRKRGGFRWEQHGAPLDAFSRLACQSELELAAEKRNNWGNSSDLVVAPKVQNAMFLFRLALFAKVLFAKEELQEGVQMDDIYLPKCCLEKRLFQGHVLHQLEMA